MKKILLYSFALLTAFATVSCSDKDEASYDASSDRLMAPVFRTNRTVAKGQTDPYLCQVVGRNNMQLYWSQVKGAMGYEIRASYDQSIANAPENWEDKTKLVLDTILMGETQDQMLLKDLLFSKTYRFAIRALSPLGEAHHSNWFGTGNLHQWTDMVYYDMLDKYKVPYILSQKADIGEDKFDLYMDRSYDHSGTYQYSADELADFNENYNKETDNWGNTVWKVDYLVIEPAASNPDATVPAEYKFPGKNIRDLFGADGSAKVTIEGLEPNAVYNMYTYDEAILREKGKTEAGTIDIAKGLNYAQQNLNITVRTKGDPGEPIVIEPNPQDTMHYISNDAELSIKLPIAATSIQPLLEEFMKSMDYAENKVFYLRGGECYFVRAGLEVYKGFKLATHPDDLAAGKERAKVFLYYPQVLDISGGTSPSPAMFMLSRNPIGSENPMITIDIDKIQLEDIDFSIPYARNIGDGSKVVSNSYFMNMYSSGMGSVVEELSIKNCSFQGIVGGFYRVQANYGVVIKNFIIDNVDFYNNGYYSTSGRRYNWFHANPDKSPLVNIWQNFVMKNSTIFDCPVGYMFNHNSQKSVEWANDLHYNITLENNTFINLNTCNEGNSMLFNTRWIPGGSSYTIKRNLFVLTRNDDDTERTMVQAGCDIRTINGSGTITLDFEDNYSTNDNLTDGQIWSNTASAFDYTQKNTFGALSKTYDVTWGNPEVGAEGLTVKVADISAKDLMVQPNPPHKFNPAAVSHWDHQCDGIDGTVTNVDKQIRSDYQPGMVDLHFKNKSNVLVEKQIGAPKWRQ